jgi:hypothetical protein
VSHGAAPWCQGEATVFTEAERAALELTEQGTRIADAAGDVTDDAWANAAKHYDNDHLAAMVCLIALINNYNRLNVVTRQPAGDYQDQARPSLGGARRAEREPHRVTVAGEVAAVGDAGHDLEDDAVTVGTLAHARRWLGDRPDQRPGLPPHTAAAFSGPVLSDGVQHAVLSGVPAGQPKPGHLGTLQMRDQMHLGLLGNPARAAGQARQFLGCYGEGAGVGHPGEPVVGIPSLAGIHGAWHRPHLWLVGRPPG